MSHNSQTRSNATHNENNNAANQQVSNPATQAQGTPVPAKLEDLESRLAEYTTGEKDAKKKAQKANENLAKMRDLKRNERYCVAVSRMQQGKADAEDLKIIASRKAEENAETGLAKAMASMPKDTDEVAKAREKAKGNEGSLTRAIDDTLKEWADCYATLYGTIGISKKSLTPALLKNLCPYLLVASADGLKAATVNRTAVRKNGKAVKQDGKRVYKFTLHERTRWTAYGLFETLERNHHWQKFFSSEDMAARKALLDAEVKALAAYKAAKETAEKSDVPEQAAQASESETALAAAAKAAGQALKQNTDNATQHTTNGGKLTKVA